MPVDEKEGKPYTLEDMLHRELTRETGFGKGVKAISFLKRGIVLAGLPGGIFLFFLTRMDSSGSLAVYLSLVPGLMTAIVAVTLTIAAFYLALLPTAWAMLRDRQARLGMALVSCGELQHASTTMLTAVTCNSLGALLCIAGLPLFEVPLFSPSVSNFLTYVGVSALLAFGFIGAILILIMLRIVRQLLAALAIDAVGSPEKMELLQKEQEAAELLTEQLRASKAREHMIGEELESRQSEAQELERKLQFSSAEERRLRRALDEAEKHAASLNGDSENPTTQVKE